MWRLHLNNMMGIAYLTHSGQCAIFLAEDKTRFHKGGELKC